MTPEKRKVALDAVDGCVLVGYGMLVAGIWWLSPPWALIIGGALALGYGLAVSWLRGRGGE